MAIDKARKGGMRASGRDHGGFVALPWSVLDCPTYVLLSHPARSLLIEIARQYIRNNNGQLLTSSRYLLKRGWRSADVIQRAKRDLIEAGFIYETVKGHRPNKASWYAITWQDLDKHTGYDAGAFAGWRDARSSYQSKKPLKNKLLIPLKGIERGMIAPFHVIAESPAIPSEGANKISFRSSSIPSNGNHLDIPSKEGIDNVT